MAPKSVSSFRALNRSTVRFIAAECLVARAVVAQVFGGLESRKAQAEGRGCQ